jgi:hypothetical protein
VASAPVTTTVRPAPSRQDEGDQSG